MSSNQQLLNRLTRFIATEVPSIHSTDTTYRTQDAEIPVGLVPNYPLLDCRGEFLQGMTLNPMNIEIIIAYKDAC